MDFVSRGRMGSALMGLSFLLFNGCVTYAPNPVDWEQERQNWQPHDAEPMVLTLGDVLTLANVANPEVNRVRLRHATLKRQAGVAGWWEDPSLDAGVSRLLKGGGWTRAAGVSLVIPLTGIPGLERKAAEAYAGAGAFEVLLAERRLAAEVRGAWVELAAATEQHGVIEAFYAAAEKDHLDADERARADGLPREELPASRRVFLEAGIAREASLAAIHEKRAALFEWVGIHPSRKTVFEGLNETRDGSFAFVAEADLISHPAVMAKLAEFEATEQQLRIEIRRQWPRVSLGPTTENDGGWRGGFAFGVTLPLWNRNRAGVASAEGLRGRRARSAWKCGGRWCMRRTRRGTKSRRLKKNGRRCGTRWSLRKWRGIR